MACRESTGVRCPQLGPASTQLELGTGSWAEEIGAVGTEDSLVRLILVAQAGPAEEQFLPL